MNNCLWCQGETSNPKFCSLSCGAKHQQSMTAKYSRINYCNQCEKPYKYIAGKKFCTRSCAAIFNNLKRGVAKENNKCSCGKVINKYSSMCAKCIGKQKRLDKINNWVSGEWDATTLYGLAVPIKRYLVEQANYKCSRCGWDKIHPVTKKCPLEINHIDGNAYNNKAENLEVICPNCHSLTPNYRALNKNSRREYRRKS